MEHDTLDSLLEQCRKSYYHDLADVLEHFGDHEQNQCGPVYGPYDAPHVSSEEAKRLLWAFRAGRAHEREQD